MGLAPCGPVFDRSRRGSVHQGRPRRGTARRGFGAGRQRRQSALSRGRQDTPDSNRPVETAMKRAIVAVIFCLAAASTAGAADDTLAGLVQAGNRDAALKMIAAGADVNAAQGDGTTPLNWAVYKVDKDLARALLQRGAKPDVDRKSTRLNSSHL